MQTLEAGERGRLDPAHEDGHAIAEASAYTGASAQVSAREAVAVAGGVPEDPTGAMTVTRAKTGAPVTVPMGASRTEMQTELRKLFTSYSLDLTVPVGRLYRDGTVQVRCVHGALQQSRRCHIRASAATLCGSRSAHRPCTVQVKEWIVEMPHPNRLPAAEAEAVVAESAALLTLQVPAPAEAVTALDAPATVTFAGGITVQSSLADTPQVYLNRSMTTSEMASLIRTLPGVRGIDVTASGWDKREIELSITFLAEQYAIGDVPELRIVSHDIEGASRRLCW